MQRIRSPIISVLGHVDHGKTTLLDKIRGTAVAKSEPGLITQYISASWVPLQVIQGVAGELLKKLGIELTIPGLLWIDLPGHAAFTTLRKRGGAIADLAVLVVDILEGFKPQTDESLMFLKQFKTPFILALTKIDRVPGWIPNPEKPFLETFEQQSERTREELEKRLYQIAGQLSSRGFESDRYDRVVDFRKQVAIVPVSGVTGEGIPDLLMVLAGIAQKFLLERLELKLGEGKGAVLEVKPFRGLGLTLDVILYDGEIRVGDWLVVGGREPVKSRVRAILLPKPLRELRAETAFQRVQEVQAAAGLKLAAPDIEKVVPGSPLRTVRKQEEVERAIKEVQAEVEEVEIETQKEGMILKADTLGSLEALIKCIKELGLPIRKAEVGNLTKSDLLELKPLPERICFCFGLKVPEELE
ncbi:MAG: translation initiation factor IF-2, partial [Candidatus Aenigmatarchaeota archaeon]